MYTGYWSTKWNVCALIKLCEDQDVDYGLKSVPKESKLFKNQELN